MPHLIDKIKNKTSKWKTETVISSEIETYEEYYNDVFISVTCSGTASLEIAKRNIPQIIIYKLNFLTELILKFLVKVKNACIINIISKKIIIPEIVNSNLSNRNLINAFEILLNNNNFRNEQIKNINYYLPTIEKKESPYEISVKKILSLI